MDGMLKVLAFAIGCSFLVVPSFSQTPIDLSRNVYTFTGEPTSAPKVDFSLLEEPKINVIANECIHGATRDQLNHLNFENLDTLLQRMVSGNLIANKNGILYLTFPVILGETRLQLDALVDKKAAALVPQVEVILDQIYTAVPNNRGIAFHLLWSRVMDRMWYETWKMEGRPGKGPPFVNWAIFPESAFTVGTSSWDGAIGGGSNAVTWSHRSICSSFHLGSHQQELLSGGWGYSVDPATVGDLQPLGIFDPKGDFTGFAYHDDDSLGLQLKRQVREYATLVKNSYDYEALSKKWGIPVDALWTVIHHETAYAILRKLSASGKLTVPQPLLGLGDRTECRAVLSVRLVDPPSRGAVTR